MNIIPQNPVVRERLFTITKYLVYGLLAWNGYMFYLDESLASDVTFSGGMSLSEIIEVHSGSIDTLAERHPLIGEVRGIGLICAIQLVKDKDQKILFAKEDEVGTRCRNHCFENNLIMRAVDQSMVMSPPLTISKSEIDELLQKAEHCLDLTASDLGLS